MLGRGHVTVKALALLLALCNITIGQEGQWVEAPWSNVPVTQDMENDPLQRLFPTLPLNRYAFVPVVWTAAGFSSDPDHVQMMDWIDDVFEKAAVPGEQQDAIGWMRDIASSYSQFRVARSYLAVVLLQCGTEADRLEAEDIFNEELELDNRNWMGHNNLGVLLEMRGEAHDALESYLIATEAIEESCYSFPRCADSAALVLFNAGRLLRRKEEDKEETGEGGAHSHSHAPRAFAAAARLHSAKPLSAPFLFYTSQTLRALATASAAQKARKKQLEDASRTQLLRAMAQPGFNFDAPREQLRAEDAEVLRKRRFDTIFNTKFWHPESESASGPGSNVDMTEPTRQLIEGLVSELGVTSVLDVGCGDLMWIKRIDWRGVDYAGIDIAVVFQYLSVRVAMRGPDGRVSGGAPKEGVIEGNKLAMAELRKQCAEEEEEQAKQNIPQEEEEERQPQALGSVERCERLPRSEVFGMVDVVRGFPARLCGLDTALASSSSSSSSSSSFSSAAEEPARGMGKGGRRVGEGESEEREQKEQKDEGEREEEDGRCELVVLKEVLIHLTVEDIRRTLLNLHTAALEARGRARSPQYLLATHDEAVTLNNDISVSLLSSEDLAGYMA